MNLSTNSSSTTSSQKKYFYLSASVVFIAIGRNLRRMNKYTQKYIQFKRIQQQQFSIIDKIQTFKDTKKRELVLFENISPNFPPKYFQNIQNYSKYKSFRAKFYESLKFQNGFEGTIYLKGKKNAINFEMNQPSVGFIISSTARDYQKRGMSFHKSQQICAYGYLSYIKEFQRFNMQVLFLGLDNIQIQKYWQTMLLSNIFSNFFFSILLGLLVSVQMNMKVITKQEIEQMIQCLNLKSKKLIEKWIDGDKDNKHK